MSSQESKATENVSQWMDGETGHGNTESVLTTLKTDAGRKAWDIYHQIGDVLREGNRCSSVSESFQARFAEVLAKEPTVVAARVTAGRDVRGEHKPHYRAWALAATVAGAAVIGWMSLIAHNDRRMADQVAIKGSDSKMTMVSSADEDKRIFNPTPATYSLAPVEKNTSIPTDYLITHQEYVPSTAFWSGVNTYQRADGVWGDNQDLGREQ